MAYRNDNENLKVRLKYCQGFIALLVLMIAGLGVGWDRARQDAVIHLPPNLEDGGQVKLNQPQRSHIFAFASRILQVINQCSTLHFDEFLLDIIFSDDLN